MKNKFNEILKSVKELKKIEKLDNEQFLLELKFEIANIIYAKWCEVNGTISNDEETYQYSSLRVLENVSEIKKYFIQQITYLENQKIQEN